MITGSLIHTTRVGDAIRGWLVFNTQDSRVPVLLNLPDGPNDLGVHEAGKELQYLLQTVTDEQLAAVAQQSGTDMDGFDLVARTLRWWEHLPRLRVAWDLAGRPTEVWVYKGRQQGEPDVRAGDEVLVAGDSFSDVKGVAVEERDRKWRVILDWEDLT